MSQLPAPAPQDLQRRRVPSSLALYVHVPFCETKCPYCDFNTYARIEPLMAPYVEAVCRELALWGATLERPRVSTVFFGGGTPSYLGPENLRRVLEAIEAGFHVNSGAEATAECNPGDLTEDRVGALAGVPLLNRLSIGVQAFQDHHLEALGRRHTAAEAESAYRRAREAGFRNVNLDLMFGLPRQTAAEWEEGLDRALALAPEHLSLYCLTLEEGTPLERQVSTGQVPEPDPDLAAEQYETAMLRLERAGYEHYEISNWARPGLASRHNLTYWRNEPYLGVGPGAHSSLAGLRFADVKAPREYIARVNAWQKRGAGPAETLDATALAGLGPVTDVQAIDRATEMAETMMMGLRLSEGVSLERFRLRFGVEMGTVYGEAIAELMEGGLVETAGGALRLTHAGKLLGNEVFARFLNPPP